MKKTFLIIAGLLLSIIGIHASAGGDASAGEDKVMMCMGCHGSDGLTPKDTVEQMNTSNMMNTKGGANNQGGCDAGYQPTDVDIAYFRNYKSTPASLFVIDETENPNGFCDLKDTLVNMDQKCSEQPLDVCASTNCCVLMGGQKCVYGNEFGPINKTVYSDTSIKNRDVYYYRGKCYGDCL